MPTIEAACYKDLAHQSHCGNVNYEKLEYTFTGAETNGTVVKLRKKSEYNTYWRMRIIADAAFNAGSDIDLGYISREDGGTDDPDKFGAGHDIVASQDIEAFALPLEVAEKHDLVMVINDNNIANAGKKVTILVESVATSG